MKRPIHNSTPASETGLLAWLGVAAAVGMHETPCTPRAQALKADVELNVEELLKDPTSTLRSMLHIVPGWDHECAKEAQVQQISGAMSNLVYRCSSARAHENATVIVRVFGRGGEVFSAGSERAIFVRASTLGLGPRCLVEFVGGRVEEFLPGLNLTPLTMRQPAVAAAIARAMAHFNVEMLPAAGSSSSGSSGSALVPCIWSRLRQWHKVAVEVAPKEVEQLGLTHADKEISQLEASFTAHFPLWLGFVHNDLQYGNMLLFVEEQAQLEAQQQGGEQQQGSAAAAVAEPAGTDAGTHPLAAQQGQQQQGQQQNGVDGGAGEQEEEEEGLAVRLIDYEYSGVNDVALDVGNYWVEYCYDYHSDTPEAVDWSLFPTLDQQRSFCAAYIAAMAEVLQQLRRQQKEQPHGTAAAAAEGAGGSADGGCALAAEDSAFLGVCAGGSAGSAGNSGSNGSNGTDTSGSGNNGGEPGIALAEAVLSVAGGQQGVGNGTQHERAVELLAEKARAYATITHLHWSLWGLIQLKMSDCDFSYFEYSRQRVELYHKYKVDLLS